MRRMLDAFARYRTGNSVGKLQLHFLESILIILSSFAERLAVRNNADTSVLIVSKNACDYRGCTLGMAYSS